MAGSMIGTKMPRSVRGALAPETRDASSSDAFMLRKPGVSSITIALTLRATRCVQTIPQKL